MSIKDAMTEDVARTRWCPFARQYNVFGDDEFGPYNRAHIGVRADEGKDKLDHLTLCLASRCMAWRWSEEKRTQAYLQAVVEHMKATGDNFNKATQEVVKRREEFSHTEGFCGLAGQP